MSNWYVVCSDCGEPRKADHSFAWAVRNLKRPSRCFSCTHALKKRERRVAVGERLASGLKRCCRCKKERPLGDFNHATRHLDGLSSRCRQCEAEYQRENYAATRETRIANAKRWVLANPERRREIAREHSRRFRRAHPERARDRRDRTNFESILAAHGMVCHICGGDIPEGDLHFDHVVPLSRGGAHAPDNIRPSHSRCNLRKGTKLMHELAA